MECGGTRCEHQDSLPQEQWETVCSLEVDCDQVGLVGPNAVERVSDANGSMQSLGGVEASGSLVRTPTTSVIVPECVSRCANGVSVTACVSACVEMDDGPIQTGDLNGKLNRPQRVNLATAPGSRDGAYDVHGAFRARPAHVRLRDRNPAREHSTSDMSRPRGR